MSPGLYWQTVSHRGVAAIHRRLLEHIKKCAEWKHEEKTAAPDRAPWNGLRLSVPLGRNDRKPHARAPKRRTRPA